MCVLDPNPLIAIMLSLIFSLYDFFAINVVRYNIKDPYPPSHMKRLRLHWVVWVLGESYNDSTYPMMSLLRMHICHMCKWVLLCYPYDEVISYLVGEFIDNFIVIHELRRS